MELQASAVVHGDIVTKRLLVQEGGAVNGAVRMDSVNGQLSTVNGTAAAPRPAERERLTIAG